MIENHFQHLLWCRWAHGPFGETLRSSGLRAATCNWKFATRYTDLETGFAYHGFRYRNPSLSMWLSRDPMTEGGGVNVYSVGNRMTGTFDPFGLSNEPPNLCFPGPNGIECRWDYREVTAKALAFNVDTIVVAHWAGGMGLPLYLPTEFIIDSLHKADHLAAHLDGREAITIACRGHYPPPTGLMVSIKWAQYSGFAALGDMAYVFTGTITCCENKWRAFGRVRPEDERFDFNLDQGSVARRQFWQNVDVGIGLVVSRVMPWPTFKEFWVRFVGDVRYEDVGTYLGG